MRRTPITIALLCAAMLAACLGLPAGASASSRQVTIMQDDGLLLRSGDSTRSATLDEFQTLGVDVVKVQVYWNEIAPKGSKKPSGFDATNPAGYNWHDYDGIVRGAVARGMQPYLVLGNRASRVGQQERRQAQRHLSPEREGAGALRPGRGHPLLR